LDRAGLRKLVVISAALQLLVVTALYRPGKPPGALKASPRSGSVCTPGCPAVQSRVVPAERNPAVPSGFDGSVGLGPWGTCPLVCRHVRGCAHSPGPVARFLLAV